MEFIMKEFDRKEFIEINNDFIEELKKEFFYPIKWQLTEEFEESVKHLSFDIASKKVKKYLHSKELKDEIDKRSLEKINEILEKLKNYSYIKKVRFSNDFIITGDIEQNIIPKLSGCKAIFNHH
jgi:histidyl-tRNA synthetase